MKIYQKVELDWINGAFFDALIFIDTNGYLRTKLVEHSKLESKRTYLHPVKYRENVECLFSNYKFDNDGHLNGANGVLVDELVPDKIFTVQHGWNQFGYYYPEQILI